MTEFETTHCDECKAELEVGQTGICESCQRTANEALLAEALQLQHHLWDKLRELEEALDIEIDANTDLEVETIESLIAADTE
jgi:hypothetical protein